MIVSQSRNFVFIAIPKTASQSIRSALKTCLTQDDWQQESMYQQKRLPIPSLSEKQHGHITALEIAEFIPFNHYFSFAFVRHPLQRFVSALKFKFRANPHFNANPIESTKALLKTNLIHQDLWFWPQSHFVCNQEGKVMVNFIGKVENLNHDFQELNSKLNLPLKPLESLNATIKTALDAELESLVNSHVYRYYAHDFNTFGYA